MSSIEVYAVQCRRCGVDHRVPGWDQAASVARPHAEHGGNVQIKRVWLRALVAA